MKKESTIRSTPAPVCYLCGSAGRPLYNNLKDNLFGVEGYWGLSKCTNQDCCLVWLNPMPLEEDIGEAYDTYYTHSEGDIKIKEGIFSRVVRWNLEWILNMLKRITLIRRERKRLNLMYMNKVKSGRLLEVGCGSGSRLSKMRAIGWEVEGQEVDPVSAKYAQDIYGLKVHLGLLQNISFQENRFDAIIINHVIEHVYDPVALFAECLRILKPCGVMVAVTPNIDSFGHRYFGASWFGLDPPRHLHLFSQHTLKNTAQKAGFSKIVTWTTMAKEEVFATASLNLKNKGAHVMGERPDLHPYFYGILFQLAGWAIKAVKHDSGGECVLKAIK